MLLKSKAVEEASLCMLLWKDSHTFVGKRTSPLARWGLAVAYHLGDAFYNTKGMTHFKTRFRPELSNCYVVCDSESYDPFVHQFLSHRRRIFVQPP